MTENKKIAIESVVQETGVPMDTVHTVLRQHLSLSKVCARSVLQMFEPKMNNVLAMLSAALLAWYKADTELFHSRKVTGDEAWVHYHNPESKS